VDELKKYLESVAAIKQNCETDDPYGFNAQESSGCNYDDAYSMGEQDGEISFARELLLKYFT